MMRIIYADEVQVATPSIQFNPTTPVYTLVLLRTFYLAHQSHATPLPAVCEGCQCKKAFPCNCSCHKIFIHKAENLFL